MATTSYVPLLTNHFGQFNQTKAADMYPDTDFGSLNVFERLWGAFIVRFLVNSESHMLTCEYPTFLVSWYVWIGNPVIATGLMSFLMHEIVYFGRCIPWMIIDRMPYFRKWKLQPGKVPTNAQMWKCTKAVLFSHFTIELPQVRSFPFICQLDVGALRLTSGLVVDLGIPPACGILWTGDAFGAVPFVEIDGSANRLVLCV